jgi:hypothetical protein
MIENARKRLSSLVRRIEVEMFVKHGHVFALRQQSDDYSLPLFQACSEGAARWPLFTQVQMSIQVSCLLFYHFCSSELGLFSLVQILFN